MIFVLALAAVADAQDAPPPPAPSPPPPAQPVADPPPPVVAPSPPMQPQVQAPGMQPAVPPRPSVMAKRWAIGLDVGPESLQPNRDGSDKTDFGQLELAGRFRIRAPIEVGIALHLGASKDISEGGFYLEARYRFRPDKPLDVYATGGLGVLAVAHKEASEDAKRGRGSLRIGAGIEYRWSWFALIAELRLVGVGENDTLAPMAPETVDYRLSRYKLSGGSLALGTNFYF